MTRIDRKIKAIMSLKDRVGDFSLDLYYNDLNNELPYTARLRGTGFPPLGLHFRKKNFMSALICVEQYLKASMYE